MPKAVKQLWRLGISGRCHNVEGEGYSCMACDKAEATGHVIVNGGPNHGRLILLICEGCAAPADKGVRIKKAIIEQAVLNRIEIETGGPGVLGTPMVWHRDHHDPIPQHRHDYN